MTCYKTISVVVFFLIIKFSYSQDSIICKSSPAVVSNAKLNVLYIGVDNPIYISLSEYKSFIVKIDEGTILKVDEGYVARVNRIGTNYIHLLNHKGNEIISFPFRVKKIPTPYAIIRGKFQNGNYPYYSGGEITKKDILFDPTLIPVIDFDFELFFKINSYKVEIIYPEGRTENFDITGNHFSLELIEKLQESQKETRIRLYEIKGQLAAYSEIKYDLEELKFIIIE